MGQEVWRKDCEGEKEESEEKEKKMIVYTGGTFDVLTVGHIDLFKWCRKIAGKKGKVIIALNTDSFVKRYKGKTPSMCFGDRKALLEALQGLVDLVITNKKGEDSKPAILQARADVIIVGSDWLKKDYMKQMNFTPEWLEKHRIALMYIPRYIDISSSRVKERIRK